MTHVCINKLTIIGSDNGLSPGRHQAIIWTNAGILLIRNSGKNFNEILSEFHIFLFKKMHLNMLSTKWQQFCLGLNVLRSFRYHDIYVICWFWPDMKCHWNVFSLLLKSLTLKLEIFWKNQVDTCTMAADSLGLCIIRPSAAMLLIMLVKKWALSSMRKDFNHLLHLSVNN